VSDSDARAAAATIWSCGTSRRCWPTVRLFRERTGLPPHALQVAHRVRAARRLLEAGETIAETAAATGFADQSHLHRHFQRSLGLTPGEYQTRFDLNTRS
jgi:AraC-like DNA-binding protein